MSVPDIRAIVSANQDANALIEGFTPLTWACMLRDRQLLDDLLKLRSSPSERNTDETTPLTWAPDLEFANALICGGARVTDEPEAGCDVSLHRAASRGDSALLELLLKEGMGGCRINSFDDLGLTPLACAAKAGQLACLEKLLAHGADPNYVDKDLGTYTPLQFALKARSLDSVKRLLMSGADPAITHRLVCTQDIADSMGLGTEFRKLIGTRNS